MCAVRHAADERARVLPRCRRRAVGQHVRQRAVIKSSPRFTSYINIRCERDRNEFGRHDPEDTENILNVYTMAHAQDDDDGWA